MNPLLAKISKNQTPPLLYKRGIPTMASPASHINSRELTSNLKLRKQKLKKCQTQNQKQIYNKGLLISTTLNDSINKLQNIPVNMVNANRL